MPKENAYQMTDYGVLQLDGCQWVCPALSVSYTALSYTELEVPFHKVFHLLSPVWEMDLTINSENVWGKYTV